MHGDYIDRNILQDTEIYYFGANTHDKEYDFKLDSCVIHAATLQAL